MIGFVFPSSFENKRKCDEAYESQYLKLRDSGFDVFLIDIDNLNEAKPYPQIPDGLKLIYRGWMLDKENYQLLYKKTNNALISDVDSYLNSHHSPNWYFKVKEFTCEKIITDEENVVKEFNKKQWSKALIKDYVKSLKTGKGSIVESEEDINNAISDMKKFKGFVEGGIVLNKFVYLLPETEKRFFVLNGNVFSDSSIMDFDLDLLGFAQQIAPKHNEFFYSIDIARDKDKKPFLVEIGDGQVSDMTGWSEDDFIKIFDSLKPKKQLKI